MNGKKAAIEMINGKIITNGSFDVKIRDNKIWSKATNYEKWSVDEDMCVIDIVNSEEEFSIVRRKLSTEEAVKLLVNNSVICSTTGRQYKYESESLMYRDGDGSWEESLYTLKTFFNTTWFTE